MFVGLRLRQLEIRLSNTQVTLTGIRNGFVDDMVNTIKEAYEHVKDQCGQPSDQWAIRV